MKTYIVTITEDSQLTYEIEANSPQEAEDKVLDGEGILIRDKTFNFDIDVEEI